MLNLENMGFICRKQYKTEALNLENMGFICRKQYKTGIKFRKHGFFMD